MNYEKNYYDYIEYVKTLDRKKGEGIYYESHHIIPKSMGGDNSKDNLVLLTAREHYLAHYLLYKIYKNSKMIFAFWFINNDRKHKCNSRFYELSRKLNSEKLKEKWSKPGYKEKIKQQYFNYYNSLSEEEKNEMNKASKEYQLKQQELLYTGKKVICIETNKIYKDIIEAGDTNNIKYNSILQCCRKNIKHINKLHWEFYIEGRIYITYKKTKYNIKIHKPRKEYFDVNKITKKIICLNTGKIYNSIKKVSNLFNIPYVSLQRTLSGNSRYETVHGYSFRYYEEGKDYTIVENKKESNHKKVICTDTGKIFNSVVETARNNNISETWLREVLKENRYRIKGLHYEYYNEDR
ncbi:MAG: HNH endonuclease [Methanobrevibacter sp.]|jgi:hypothetical protein|nr:HNH endonuclease [Methanobrevibacter sp.]